METTAIRQTIGDLSRAFLADMEALPPAAWQQPSDCDGWSIAGAFIHIVQVSELLGDSLARGQAGDPGPPPLAASDGVMAWRAARTARQQLALTQSPTELFEWYHRGVGALEAELDAIPGADPSARGWHPTGAQTLEWIQDQWLFELALHDWDIRVALDPTADVRPEVQAAFARTLPARLGRGFNGGDNPALAGSYRIELAADPPYTLTLQVGNGALSVVPNESVATPDVTIATDPSAFGLVGTNRRPVAQFAEAGRWQTSGDAAKAAGFAEAFKSY
jgi:uncharacterized protein (TIGR03083 family)